MCVALGRYTGVDTLDEPVTTTIVIKCLLTAKGFTNSLIGTRSPLHLHETRSSSLSKKGFWSRSSKGLGSLGTTSTMSTAWNNVEYQCTVKSVFRCFYERSGHLFPGCTYGYCSGKAFGRSSVVFPGSLCSWVLHSSTGYCCAHCLLCACHLDKGSSCTPMLGLEYMGFRQFP
jgi:hypothetical protein